MCVSRSLFLYICMCTYIFSLLDAIEGVLRFCSVLPFTLVTMLCLLSELHKIQWSIFCDAQNTREGISM